MVDKVPPLHAIRLYLLRTKGTQLTAPDLWAIHHKGQKNPKRYLHYARRCATALGKELDMTFFIREAK